MRKIFGVFCFFISMIAHAATTIPVQLINPTGSSSGQAIVSTGASSAPAWGGVGVNGIAALAANTVLANATGSSASPTAFAMPSCTTALEWVSGSGFACNSSGAFTTLSATGAITPSQTAGIVGTTTNNNANAGSIGEYQTNTTTGTSLSTGVAANCTSLSLTAGDWSVSGVVHFVPAGSTTVTYIAAGISTTSATFGSFGTFVQSGLTFTTGSPQDISAPTVRISIASTTTVYLIGDSSFGVSTMTCNGFIAARRIR